MEGPLNSEASKLQHQTSLGPMERKQRQRVKQQVCDEVVRRLQDQGHPYTLQPQHAEELLAHFMRLPTRYAMDVNTERAEDVLTHMRLLGEAQQTPDPQVPRICVRAVRLPQSTPQLFGADGMDTDIPPQVQDKEQQQQLNETQEQLPRATTPRQQDSFLSLPAFGSSQNLEQQPHSGAGGGVGPFEEGAMDEDLQPGGSGAVKGITSVSSLTDGPLHEITFSCKDRPKLLSKLSAFLADVGLNIREAHVFSTSDGLSLDVFVADGWLEQDPAQLQGVLLKALESGILETSGAKPDPARPASAAGLPTSSPMAAESAPAGATSAAAPLPIPFDGKDDWEIDVSQLKLHHKVASGSFGHLFRGTYCGQDVAIKILKLERLNDSLQQEFAQEVFIMRKVRHKNVVQFIGACTKPPNLSIVTEFMSGGSVFDYLHKHKGSMKPPMLIRVALDVAKGMDFLHKNKIIHRDLKAANLLMDENEVVKVADFGVARVQASSGIMTAETGTYRWMAPEVIEHRAYDHKADVFSYGITLWELLTGKVPYSDLTPLQAAVSVVQKGLRPPIPKGTLPRLAELMERCWHKDPSQRPEFGDIISILTEIAREVDEENQKADKKNQKKGGFFQSFKRQPGM